MQPCPSHDMSLLGALLAFVKLTNHVEMAGNHVEMADKSIGRRCSASSLAIGSRFDRDALPAVRVAEVGFATLYTGGICAPLFEVIAHVSRAVPMDPRDGLLFAVLRGACTVHFIPLALVLVEEAHGLLPVECRLRDRHLPDPIKVTLKRLAHNA